MRSLFATIGTTTSALFVAGIVFSIFSTNLAMGSDTIDLSRLVAPALLPETAPPPPDNPANEKTIQKSTESTLPIRVQNIQRLDEVPVKVPDRVSTTPGKFLARPKGPYIVSPSGDSDGSPGTVSNASGRKGSGGPVDPGFVSSKPIDEPDKNPPISKTTGPPPALAKKLPPISGGVINGKALNLVVPVRSAAAVAINAKGQVRVNVLISEAGRVESASASSGHAMLRNEAVAAALRSTFKPTTVSALPVKVRGVIIYNFN